MTPAHRRGGLAVILLEVGVKPCVGALAILIERHRHIHGPGQLVRVASELISSSAGPDLRGTMVDDLQRAMAEYRESGQFRITQTTVMVPWERAMRMIEEVAESVRDEETDDAEPLVITTFMHPVPSAGQE